MQNSDFKREKLVAWRQNQLQINCKTKKLFVKKYLRQEIGRILTQISCHTYLRLRLVEIDLNGRRTRHMGQCWFPVHSHQASLAVFLKPDMWSHRLQIAGPSHHHYPHCTPVSCTESAITSSSALLSVFSQTACSGGQENVNH